MSKIEKFEKWAKQFISIQDSHVREFLDSAGSLSLYEIKCRFSERYQDRIDFSYILQMERTIIKDISITINTFDYLGGHADYKYGSGSGDGDSYSYGNFKTKYGAGKGYSNVGYIDGQGYGSAYYVSNSVDYLHETYHQDGFIDMDTYSSCYGDMYEEGDGDGGLEYGNGHYCGSGCGYAYIHRTPDRSLNKYGGGKVCGSGDGKEVKKKPKGKLWRMTEKEGCRPDFRVTNYE